MNPALAQVQRPSSPTAEPTLENLSERLIQLVAETAPMTWVLVLLALAGMIMLPKRTKVLGLATAVALVVLPPSQAFLFILLLLGAIASQRSINHVPEGTVGIVERFGRFHRIVQPGMSLIVPGLERIKDLAASKKLYTFQTTPQGKTERNDLFEDRRWISTKEQLLDPGGKRVICSDNTEVMIDSVAYFTILDPERAVYNVDRVGEALVKLMETSLRQEVGKLDGDQIVVSRGPIGEGVLAAMESAAETWGIRILRVEIEDIVFVDDNVQQALNEARGSELTGRARIAEAQRTRDADIAEAEGKKRANILVAEGEFEAQRLQAEGEYLLELKKRQGEAEGLKAIAEALRESPDAAVALEALKAQQSVARSIGSGTNTMILPAEATGLFGALGALKHFKGFLSHSDPGAEPAHPQRREVSNSVTDSTT